MKKLIRLIEVEKGAVELRKGTSDAEIKKYTDKGIDVQLVDPSTEKLEEGEKKYTTQESAAVGKEVAKSLVKVLRGQGDEVTNVKLTGVGVNTFNIHVTYGNEKGEDTFKFKLNPESEDIHIQTEQGDEPLTDFLITQGNTVSLPAPELESRLADVMKKYVSQPVPMDEKLGPKSKPETYIKDFEKSDAPQFKGKSKEKRRQMAIAAYMAGKNEALDPVGKEDKDINNDGKIDSTDKYLGKRRQAIAKNMKEDLDLGHQDDEPGMLLGDLYSIMQSTKELYEMVSQFEGQGEVDFPHWWQAKIIKAKSCLHAAKQYLDFEVNKPQKVQKVQIATLGETTTPQDVTATTGNTAAPQTQTGGGKVDINTLKRKFRELSTSTISGLSTNEIELLLQLIPAMVNKGAGGSTETALKDVAKIYNIRTASIKPKP